MQEIDSFNQSDLNNDAVHVLDACKTIYIWTGMNADKFEKNNGDKRVEEYINALKDGRKAAEISVKKISPLEEPFYFKSFFPEWEQEVAEQWLLPDPYQAKMAEFAKIRQEKQGNGAEAVAPQQDPLSGEY